MSAEGSFVAASYRRADLPDLLRTYGEGPVIVFDLETNGLSAERSVVSCAAIKFSIDPPRAAMEERERFHRYYYPREAPDPGAERVHGLTLEEIRRRRKDRRGEASYPEHFADDGAFRTFCEGVPLFVAHNIDFDVRFVPFLYARSRFCTMKSNRRGKWPKLREAARYYGIDIDPRRLHESLYDTEVTARIFAHMLQQAADSLYGESGLFSPAD